MATRAPAAKTAIDVVVGAPAVGDIAILKSQTTSHLRDALGKPVITPVPGDGGAPQSTSNPAPTTQAQPQDQPQSDKGN
jgi:hypothetical protein